MRFKIDSPDSKGKLEIVVDSDGSGYAVNDQHMVTYYAESGTIYELMEHYENENDRKYLLDQLTQITDESGNPYTLLPIERPICVDKFAQICEDSARMAGLETAQGILEMEQTGQMEKGNDLKWCNQMIKNKFGAEAVWQFTNIETANELKASAKERGLPPFTSQKIGG